MFVPSTKPRYFMLTISPTAGDPAISVPAVKVAPLALTKYVS